MNTMVLFPTLESTGTLLIFIFLGYLICAVGKVPRSASKVISVLVTFIFTPCLSLSNLAKNIHPEDMREVLVLLGIGTAVAIVIAVVGWVLAKIFGRDDLERKSLSYAMAFSNYGYFGYPVIAAVFGDVILAKFMVFVIPTGLLINSYGYGLFVPDAKISKRLKNMFLTPMFLCMVVGLILGLTDTTKYVPQFLLKACASAGACQSPASMLLAGVVLSSLPLKKLFTSWRAYLYSALRLIVIPAFFIGVMWLCQLRGLPLFLAGCLVSLPIGLNIVVFPESFGLDSTANAQTCFISYLMAVIVLPISLSILFQIAPPM